ncbi:hypothetical protein CD29_02625 [Ureibacillus manganicus DSM 26584]|uniref:Uncharacterized protein n=1 Tax=Ureibacillus manganicus DSM 26584 TaxID=1384049 RepID=A0A0A3I6E6_9BACL|nr:hypothetical protein CD29_02625 [Ureibacillus manganicus DSM 26584]
MRFQNYLYNISLKIKYINAKSRPCYQSRLFELTFLKQYIIIGEVIYLVEQALLRFIELN